MTTASQTSSRQRLRLDRYFALTERRSTLRIEVLGGVSTFLAMSYILLVNPSILEQGGVPWRAAFVATALVAGLATLAVGVWGRLPFAVAPGMEINAFVVLTVIGQQGFSWQEALGLAVWSGVLMLAVTGAGWRGRVIDAIPPEIGTGLVLSVGMFIAVVGFKVGGFSHWSDVTMSTMSSEPAIAMYLSFGIAVVLSAARVRAAVLIGIAAAGLYCGLAGLKATGHTSGAWSDALFKADLSVITNPQCWQIVLVLFALDFFGSVAKFVGLSADTTIQQDGKVPGIKQALLVDSLATMGGGAVGSTNYVTFVESSVGIRAGARTGIAAVVTGLLLISCLAFSEVASLIPANATAGALLFVALAMVPKPALLRELGGLAVTISLVMVAVTAYTAALDQAMFAGLLVYLAVTGWQHKAPSLALLLITPVLGLTVTLQYTAR